MALYGCFRVNVTQRIDEIDGKYSMYSDNVLLYCQSFRVSAHKTNLAVI